MKMFDLRWVVVLTVTLTTAYPDSEEKAHEMLPKPEGWQQRRPGGRSPTDSSGYDMNEAYNSLADYGSTGGGGGYGSYGSESGYGLSCASGYVNASAVALLAFLFLLNIVQYVDCSSALAILSLILFIDVLRITGGRRKREAGDENDVFSFVHNGGLSALKEGLPEVVLPLMVDLMEGSEAPHCLQKPLCEANAELSLRYGVVGRVVASLLSNVVSKAFTGDHIPNFHLALEAASAGRSGHQCSLRFPKCSPKHRYSQEANTSSHHHSQHVNDDAEDVVQQLTNSNRRRRRGAQFDPQLEEEHLLMQFISDGGVEALVGDLPHVIVPLMSHMSEATQEDTETTNTCLQRPLCDANAALAGRHGALGRILGALFSNVVTKGFIGADSSRYHLALDASRWGRLSGTNCQLAYPCDPRRNVTS
ncbi:hypothetical protein Hamer_G021177 [Homarus americanus]|uniref:Uncharacterized protein n=1 Tax=Homarus americanus TaxID=6706 RepID=A0A8J5KNW0_HOMAM|nr:hypothetical protein Hamer_G021177 [Homarus americanus]